MKSNLFPMFSAARAATHASITGLLLLPASATEFTWSGTATGTWDASATNWSGASGTPWDSANGLSNTANFGTASLAAVVSGEVFTNGIKFSTAGTLSGGTINLAGTAPVINTGANTATISSLIAGGPVVKTGTGTLVLGQTSGTVNADLHIVEGTLNLNYADGAVTYAGNITGTTGVLRLDGTGASASTGATLTGNNPFSGVTHIHGRRVFLNSATLNGAIGGDIIVKNGLWPYHGLTLMANEQIADTSVLRFEQIDGPFNFLLNGRTETLAGIESVGGETQGDPGAPGNWAIVSNAGYDGGNDADGMAVGTLVVAGSGTYVFHGQLRDQNNPGGNNKLAFTKAGSGTQTLEGMAITYSGATLVNGGILVLDGTSGFKSPVVTVQSGAILRINGVTTLSTTQTLSVLSGATLEADPEGTVNYSVPAAQTLTGGGTVDGDLQVTGTLAPGDGTGTLTVTGFCDLYADSHIQWQVGGSWAAPTADRIQCQGFGVLSNNVDPTVIVIAPDSVTGFTETARTFTLVKGAETGLNFAANKFQIDASAFATATGAAGTWAIQENGNNLELTYSPDSSPISFESWAASFPGLTDSTPAGDPDNDGIDNLMEYVIGGDPRVSSTSFLPTQAIVGSNLVISFKRNDASENDTTLIGQWSSDLSAWSPVTPALVSENGTDPDDMTVTISQSNAVGGKLFGRIRVVEQP